MPIHRPDQSCPDSPGHIVVGRPEVTFVREGRGATPRPSEGSSTRRGHGEGFPENFRRIVVASYATRGPYEIEISRLKRSVRGLPFDFVFRVLKWGAEWVDVVRYKPTFLLQCCVTHPNSPILFVDADAYLHSDPSPVLHRYDDFDISIHYLRGVEMLSGTIYLPPGKKRMELLKQWMLEDRTLPDLKRPQRVLQRILKRGGYAVGRLPPEMCWIFDTSRDEYGDRVPVIEHLQASRSFRKSSIVNPLAKSREARLAILDKGVAF